MILLLVFILFLMLAVVLVFSVFLLSGVVSSIHGAPYVPIASKLVGELLSFGGLSGKDIFYDLGSGDGRVLISAVKNFGVKKAVGCEVSFWPYLESKFALALNTSAADRAKLNIKRRDFLSADLSEATFIYMYLFPKLINQLASKIACEVRPGIKILCPSFPIDLTSHPEFQLLKSQKIGRHLVYLYVLK
jgi:hypothetical protein